MDDLDRAQEADEKFRNQVLAAHANRIRSGTASLANCIDCDAEIPEPRRIAVPGCERCVRCEQINETLRRR
jgi:phage/conjugal plasmid C-4 type zinc finger TraR family protein